MWFIYILSYFAVLVQVSVLTICIVCKSYFVKPSFTSWSQLKDLVGNANITYTQLTMFFASCFFLAAGLYYVADLVEEHTVIARKIITWMILFVLAVYTGMILFEDMPWSLTICGVLAQLMHLLVMKTFPVVEMSSPSFIIALALLVANHYFAFSHFGAVFYPFVEVLGFFTLCIWAVPFALFVSLSANDNILPTHSETTSLLGNDDVVTNYFSKRSRKYGLLSFFNYAKDSILPQRTKKAF